ncbi:MAG: EAL domain-containing protein [Acidimicrobiales bacterium]
MATWLEPGAIRAVVQPIIRTADLAVVGHEALARMPSDPYRPPDWWLARAEETGLRTELELACLASAAALGTPPGEQLLFVNVSPSTLAHPGLAQVLDQLPGHLVLELSESEAVDDYGRLRQHLAPWLQRGVRLAIDDAGAGYSSLRHVIELAPDFLKLDREMVRGLDQDAIRLALVRAVVAFAREVGTHVIAEGVETNDELDAIRDAGVHFVQGYLLGRPQPQWWESPPAERVGTSGAQPDLDLAELADALAACEDATSSAEAVAEHLFRQGGLMPSVYLARGGSLRCVAQRGLWQVLDGMPGDVGITGRTWASGRPIHLEDVSLDPGYVEAIPGIVSEVCVPIVGPDGPIGALNVESVEPMPVDTVDKLARCAAVLADRLEQIHYRVQEDPWHAAANASVAISGLKIGPGLPRRALGCLLAAAGFDSGALILGQDEGARVLANLGPLAPTLGQLHQEEITHLGDVVAHIRSCYSAGDPSGHCFLGTDSLREGGARAVILLPLWVLKERIGTVVLVHSKPVRIDRLVVEPLEVLADHVAAVLALGPDHPSDRRVGRPRVFGGP